jgi:hypothetical protein
MKASFWKGFTVLLFIGIFFSHCRENNPVVPVDPCAEQTPVTAKFTMYENVSDSLFAADTVLQYNGIVFEADENYATYEWTVGDDPRTFTSKRFALNFQQPVGRIDVTLKVTKTPNLNCFPEDDGEDVLTKSLVVIDWRNSLTIGEYIGSNVSKPSEQFEVKITREFDVNNHPLYHFVNINQGCNSTYPTWSGGRGAKAFRFYEYSWYGDGCKGVDAWITLPGPDSVRIDYSYGDDSKPPTPQGYPRIKDTYVGKRKNP